MPAVLSPCWRRVVLTGAALAASLVGACRAPDYRAEADRTAYAIIDEKQRTVFGQAEPFTIETPAETLRRRLLLEQDLPRAASASLNSKDVEPIPQWPDAAYLERPAENTAALPTYLASREADAAANAPTSQPTTQPATQPTTQPAAVPLVLTLTDALQIAASESREYQAAKERVFLAALDLDLERDAFRATWAGVLEGYYEADHEVPVVINDEGATDPQTVRGTEYGGLLSLTQRLKNGVEFSGQIGLDMVSLLTPNQLFSRGIFADASVTVPLMRGSGRFIVTEPLKQAERDVMYALYEFARSKRQFVVDIASDYLDVLRRLDAVANAADNYRRLIASTRRARRLADAGRLPEIQVDQSRQDELRARNQWISAIEDYERTLDAFKLQLGLPTDAEIALDPTELQRLAAAMRAVLPASTLADEDRQTPAADAPIDLIPPGRGVPGRYELDPAAGVLIALENRLDLRTAVGRVHDTQRGVAVAADQLRADVTLLGTGAAGERRSRGSVSQENSRLRPDEGVYSALLTIDLPLERTAERNIYRASLIDFERAVRDVQALEDQIKLEIRNGLSRLLEARESILIQAEAVKVAERRVASTNLFLEAGRAEIRDLLEAQDALVNAQNALTSALVAYRIGELSLQRDLGVLEVDDRGQWTEFDTAETVERQPPAQAIEQ